MAIVSPPFDPELKAVLDVVNQSITPTLLPEHLEVLRGPGFTPSLEQLLDGARSSTRSTPFPDPKAHRTC